MQTRSSKRGNLSVVIPQEVLKDSAIGEVYMSTPETVKSSVLDDPYETWLRSQAQSLLMRSVTLDEAKLLWSHVDINTRQPFPDAVRLGPRSRILKALRAVLGINNAQGASHDLD